MKRCKECRHRFGAVCRYSGKQLGRPNCPDMESGDPKMEYRNDGILTACLEGRPGAIPPPPEGFELWLDRLLSPELWDSSFSEICYARAEFADLKTELDNLKAALLNTSEFKSDAIMKNPRYWMCIIGLVEGVALPQGSDEPLRKAVREAFRDLVGKEDDNCWSGWGLTEKRMEEIQQVWNRSKEEETDERNRESTESRDAE